MNRPRATTNVVDGMGRKPVSYGIPLCSRVGARDRRRHLLLCRIAMAPAIYLAFSGVTQRSAREPDCPCRITTCPRTYELRPGPCRAVQHAVLINFAFELSRIISTHLEDRSRQECGRNLRGAFDTLNRRRRAAPTITSPRCLPTKATQTAA